jgi:hypothetical protein
VKGRNPFGEALSDFQGKLASMLVRLARFWLALALSLAVPIQGAAALAPSACASDGQQEHAIGAPHSHGAADDHRDHGGNAGGHQDPQAHCPPCAAAAIAPSIRTFLPEGPASMTIVAPLAPPYGVTRQALDRPPVAL